MVSITMENYPILIKRFEDAENYLYGAGVTGKNLFSILSKLGFTISGFVDDDPNKHGAEILGHRILSFEELEERATKSKVNVCIASIYGNIILNRLKVLPVSIYEAFSIYQELWKATMGQMLIRQMPVTEWNHKASCVKEMCQDDLSREIVDSYAGIVRTGKTPFSKIAELASSEEHYFIPEIKALIKNPITIVDCGAYTGDIIWQLQRMAIPFSKVYAFEANPRLYEILLNNVKRIGIEGKVFPRNSAVWDTSGIVHFSVDDGWDSAGCVSEEGMDVSAERIDDVIEIPIDFLKMDIEGAESRALKGAQNVIQNSRPLLAISIYHSLDDIVNIPIYLGGLLSDYHWLIRHHSMVYSETVLYGIPEEKY